MLLQIAILTRCLNVLQALADIHPNRAHRDLKLANLVTAGFLGPQSSLKLLDWANSRSITEGVMIVANPCLPHMSSN